MALLRDNASSLLAKAREKELHDLLLAQQARVQFDAGTDVSELRSWELSLPEFLADLEHAGLGHIEVLLEHKLPYTPKRRLSGSRPYCAASTRRRASRPTYWSS